jgi:NAD+ kinase
VIKKIKEKQFTVEKKMKLQAIAKDRHMTALNEFVLRNASQIHAIRFELEVNRKKINGTLIGDGVIVSTPFGSTGYYHSITKRKFDKGIGIAFNNLIKNIRPIVLNDNTRVRIKMLRGTALLSHDNDPHMLRLHKGDTIEIKKTKKVARIIRIK